MTNKKFVFDTVSNKFSNPLLIAFFNLTNIKTSDKGMLAAWKSYIESEYLYSDEPTNMYNLANEFSFMHNYLEKTRMSEKTKFISSLCWHQWEELTKQINFQEEIWKDKEVGIDFMLEK